MGLMLRSTMPLLSTLAALVIIVHSAEDDLEDYRRDLRPRPYDTGTPAYIDAWRSPPVHEPALQHSASVNPWGDSDEGVEQYKRRRPVRKRKRRPQTSTEEDSRSQERHPEPQDTPAALTEERPIYDNPPEPHLEPEATLQQLPRRRRKRPEVRQEWTDEEPAAPRPKRRNLRRKRPNVEPRPQVNEYDMFQVYKQTATEATATDISEPIHVESVSSNRERPQEQYIPENNYKEYDNDGSAEHRNKKQGSMRQNKHKGDEAATPSRAEYNAEYRRNRHKEDTSISALSVEIDPDRLHDSHFELVTEYPKSRYTAFFSNLNKAQSNGPINPQKLKDILKNSNGVSLSEILQQNNMSLADLLQGRTTSTSGTETEKTPEYYETAQTWPPPTYESEFPEKVEEIEQYHVASETNQEESIPKIENEYTTETVQEYTTELVTVPLLHQDEPRETTTIKTEEVDTTPCPTTVETTARNTVTPKITMKRRLPPGLRRKLRLKTDNNNNTTRTPLNRDFISMNKRRYSMTNRNVTKGKEWKDMIHQRNATTEKTVEETLPTTTSRPEETTTIVENKYVRDDYETPAPTTVTEEETVTTHEEEAITTTFMTTESTTPALIIATEKYKATPIIRPLATNIGLRRQAFNNRLKKKRMKQKSSSTEPSTDIKEDIFGMANLVSASEFIARTQPTKTTINNEEEQHTTLEDFFTTETAIMTTRRAKATKRYRKMSTTTTTSTTPMTTTTEEAAKVEIQEILEDTSTSARLAKILKERNMSLAELVEHRERGSSHVHLADIFHNASKEPNPPEPFLSKSLIEPISKETYPLRALLDATPTVKATTIDPNLLENQYSDIPVVMDFGNNVNENGENMGIMSLFNKFSGNDRNVERSTLKKDSEGTPYISSVVTVNTPESEATREGRARHLQHKNQQNSNHDLVGWNQIFSLMGANRDNYSDEIIAKVLSSETTTTTKKTVEEDLDGDGLIVLEDLQHLKDFDSRIAPGPGQLDVNSYETEEPKEPGILDKMPSSTKSVTVATASIVGLSMILFLFTYGVFKWRQQKRMVRKKESFSQERIPSPVFENRKGHKNNSSSRSISPMLSSSMNIYTMSTLDSRNGKESPEYMWDSLRKPFQ